MLEFKIKTCVKKIDIDESLKESFKDPLIFYLENKNDKRSFFVTFVIIDFQKKEMVYIFTYNSENVEIVNEAPNNEIYRRTRSPHNTISVNVGVDFLTFNEDEEFFVYVNYKENIMKVYTMNDFMKNGDAKYLKICHTLYKDDFDSNYFFIGAVDECDQFKIFRMSTDLEEMDEVDSFEGPPIPPHVLRKYKDFIFLSCEFRYSKYELENFNKVITQDEIGRVYFKNSLSIPENIKEDDSFFTGGTIAPYPVNKRKGLLYSKVRDKYKVKCLNGRIMLVNLKNLTKTYYNTTGGSPAHFEIDEENDFIYTSSHNSFGYEHKLIYLEPAVIDKFRLIDDNLELMGSFSTPKGYRFTTHKIFKNNGKSYFCTFGQPNRLIVVDADKMEELYTYDVDIDELSSKGDVSLYINSRESDFEIVSIEVTKDGKYILFIGPEYVYFFDFVKREIVHKINFINIDFTNEGIELSKDYRIRTIHVDYLV